MSENLQVIIFDVDHGFCGFIKDPSGHTMMIDCGGKEKFSPAKFIKEKMMSDITKHRGYSLTKLIISHPHVDHFSDVENLMEHLAPAILKRQNISSYPEDEIDHEHETVKKYKEKLDEKYTAPLTEHPQWAISRYHFSHAPVKANDIDSNSIINNTSLISVFEFGGRKIMFSGDMEEKGWLQHLEDNTEFDGAKFKDIINGCDIFITPHHGHSSGFCSELYKHMGKPLLHIASAKSGDESVDSRYSSDDYTRGYQGKKLMTTRADGTIAISISPKGVINIKSGSLKDNL